MRKISLVLLLVAVVVFFNQCSHYDEIQANGLESKAGGRGSHNFGQDCMSCHNQSGNEASQANLYWKAAGSVYAQAHLGPANTGQVELWSGRNRTGTLYATLPIDPSGNFYSAKMIEYLGSYPAVVNASGDYTYMSSALSKGSCNSCHDGVTQSQLELQ
jgi:hypothetical protein